MSSKITDMKLPIKGKDVIATLKDGSETTVFRCACKNEKCTEWRCAITGFGMMIDVVKWRYVDE